MLIKLNTIMIKDILIEEIIRDNKITKLLGCQNETLRASKMWNNKIFSYLKSYSDSLKSFICVDVDGYENDYKVCIKVECHEDLSEGEDKRFYNRADEIAYYLKKLVYRVFPKMTGFHDVPHYSSGYLIRDISFRINEEDECAILTDSRCSFNDKTLYDKHSSGQELLNALRKYIREH